MLSEFRRKKFSTWFQHLDLDGDAFITETDFSRYAANVRRETGWSEDYPQLVRLRRATDQFWQELLKTAAGEDGRVSLAEWLMFLEQIGAKIQEEGAPKWAEDMCFGIHELLDPDGSGAVGPDEYSLWLRPLAPRSIPRKRLPVLTSMATGRLVATR